MRRDSKATIDYEYKGTLFQLTEEEHWRGPSTYLITDIKKHSEEIEFPAQANYKQIEKLALSDNSWYGRENKKEYIYPGVKKIIIPQNLGIDCLENKTFPDLEEIVLSPAHKDYSTDGKMLFKEKGTELFLALCAGRQDSVTVPKTVKKLSNESFQNTRCQEIIFENPDIQPQSYTFEHSTWFNSFKKKKEPIYVGNTFYKAFDDKPLTIKPTASRFFKEAFSPHMPRELTTHVIPPLNMMRGSHYRYDSRGCKILNLTMEKKKINWNTIASWSDLEAVHFTGHSLYKDIDGVVFSRDGNTLLYYPRCRQAASYTIPEGTRTIGRRAFSGQEYLQEVFMPGSVTQIYQGAFWGCAELAQVSLSDNIKELPDATPFQPGGVFELCPRLKKILLPQNLEHIGAYAFAQCQSLQEITIPPQVRMLGEYAFMNTRLREISLPKALSFVGKGALLFDAQDKPIISAYEGTARGLIGAIEAVPPDLTEGTANLAWHGATIRLLQEDGSLKDEIIIPESLKRASGLYIDIAWNQESFDYDEYDSCFEDIADAREKMDFAIKILSTQRDIADTPYEGYLKRMGSKVMERLIDFCPEERVVEFLKYEILSKAALKKALKLCTAKSYNTAAAYILNLTGEGKARKETAIRI